MVSTEQWWGRGPGIACPKQEALHELQRTGRAKGLSGWSHCQDWRLPEEMPASLGMPSLQWGWGCSGKGSWVLGRGCFAPSVQQPLTWKQAEGRGLRHKAASRLCCHPPAGLQVLSQATVGLALQQVTVRGRAGTKPAAHSLPPAPSCSAQSLFLSTSCSHRGGREVEGGSWGEACRGDPLNKRN